MHSDFDLYQDVERINVVRVGIETLFEKSLDFLLSEGSVGLGGEGNE